MDRKSFKFKVKALDSDSRTFEGFLSTYGTVDADNDRVLKGAFTRSLRASLVGVPLCWAFRADEPIGRAQVIDTPKGLKITGKLAEGVRRADEIYQLLKDGVVKGLSIGFKTLKSRMDGDIRELIELRLFEASLVIFPSNPEATISSVKQLEGNALERELKAEVEDFISALEEFP